MSDYYAGEIRTFAGNFAPEGWHLCNGATLSIGEYDVLFSLIGTTYGGDGFSNFNLPDLRGRAPVGEGQGPGLTLRTIGKPGGSETVTLTQAQGPAHNHAFNATTNVVDTSNPANALPGNTAGSTVSFYVDPNGTGVAGKTATNELAGDTLSTVGGGQPHENVMPSLPITYIIALYGVYPQKQN